MGIIKDTEPARNGQTEKKKRTKKIIKKIVTNVTNVCTVITQRFGKVNDDGHL